MASVPRVLLVDDDAETLRLYGFALELLGCRVVAAATARDALHAAATDPPNIVVTDLAMPGMDGFELCERLKASRATQDIPVLAVSGQALPSFQERALAAGCEEVLLKPCLPDDLYATISRVLEAAANLPAEAPLAAQAGPLHRRR
jgi:CheY-like chemotaxis protein